MPSSPVSPHQFQRLIRQTLLLPVVLLALVAALLVAQITQLDAASRWETHSTEVLSQANRILGLQMDAAADERGYLIDGNTGYLKPYRRAITEIGPAFDSLARAVSDNPAQATRLKAMRIAVANWQAQAHAQIAQRVAGGDYRNDFQAGFHQPVMMNVRDCFNQFITAEETLHRQRATATDRAARTALAVTLFSALGVGILLAVSSRRQIVSLSDTYENTLSESERARELLSTTLLSIGDAVLVTDIAGRVTLLNAVAERLTGWTHAEAMGRESKEVFPIFNETSRAAVQSPIERVIREGVVVGLANHTVLVRRDGSEIPIEDSGAPIRDTAGKLAGVVLVFRDVSERREAERQLEEVYAREHNIATRLQDALQPPLPDAVPGLKLAHHYKPALNEALVGGDFFDVFSIEKGVTYLVVGDLSGKGLAAAAQVATVRNMLRFALHNRRTLSGPVTTLNRTLAESGLLTGFATLFVARFEAGDSMLTYVNCGQEPGLLRRAATGEIELLAATGPVVGMDENSEYIERSVRLNPGDTLAVFTDGLTEAGPSRTVLLGADGVGEFLAEGPEGDSPSAIVTYLIDRVQDFAGSDGIHDDVCLIVADVS